MPAACPYEIHYKPKPTMKSQYFAEHILKLTMWHKMSEIFRAIDSGKKRILIRSANGVGKTTALAALCN